MAGSWQGLADQINTIFNDPNLLHTFNKQFTDLHGVDGKGFRFGLLASHKKTTNKDGGTLLSDAQRGQFMIDSGKAHWDGASLDLLEDKVKYHVLNMKKVQFIIQYSDDPTALVATATYTPESGPNAAKLTITCPVSPTSKPEAH